MHVCEHRAPIGSWFVLTVNNPQDFVKVATSGGRVRNGQTDDLLGVNHEHRSDGEGDALGIDVGGILVVQHVVQGGNLTFLVCDLKDHDEYLPFEHNSICLTYNGVIDVGWAELGAVLFDILHPSVMLLEAIGRETDKLHTARRKVPGTASDFTKLGGANRGEVIYERASVSLW